MAVLTASHDSGQDERLHLVAAIFNDVNRQHFNSIIPTPTFRLSTRMTWAAGRVFYRPWSMALSIPYHDRYGWDGELLATIKHECVHLYLWHLKRPAGHTKEFKAICNQIGTWRYAHAMPCRPYRYEWQCPNCKGITHTRRWFANIACGDCCNFHNHGRYARKFKLILVRDLRDESTF